MNKNCLWVTIVLTLVLSATSGATQSDSDTEQLAKSRAAIVDFATRLKAALQAAMKEGGPLNAVSVCHEQAPKIAQSVSGQRGLQIGRTSLKYRNSENRPDAWEMAVLEAFESRKTAGEDPAKIDYYEQLSENGAVRFRYMKAIPTQAICLACHGAQLDPGLAAKLDELYPNDQARGFQVGDIRGAFSVVGDL